MRQFKNILSRREFLIFQAFLPVFVLKIFNGCKQSESIDAPISIAKLFEIKDGINSFPVLRVAIIRETIESKIKLRAISLKCTHQTCLVNAAVTNSESLFVCPCHGSEFDKTGAVLKGPALLALPNYRLEVKNGDILYYPSQVVQSSWNLTIG